jgi:hypothetical protein
MWRLLLVHMTPHPRAVRLTTRQHLEALARASRGGSVVSYNAVHGVPSWLRHLRFDAVLLHTTYLCMRWNIWFEQWRRHSDWLAELDCPKLAFPQDEYWHAETLDGWLGDLGVSVVCTVLGDDHREALYPTLSRRAAFHEILTGYIDDESAERMRTRFSPIDERPNDIVYRARNLPFWLGSHGQLKHRIGEEVLRRAPGHELTCDISTKLHETVLGDAWLDFLGSGKATVGAESGSSTLDRRGELQAQVDELLAEEPDLTFEQVDERLPPGWDDYRFFAVSPRHLEAVVTKTAQILVEGRYSDVLEPERHYIPIARDFSNLDEVLERARDTKLLADIAERAYEDVYLSGRNSSRQLTTTVEKILEDHVGPGRSAATTAFRAAAGVAEAQAEVERLAVAPVANTLRTGREGFREVLAGTRLLVRDGHARRLLADYATSTETREHVAPRVALADLLCLGAMRRGRFLIEPNLDESRHRLVLRSRPPGSTPDGTALSREELDSLLSSGAWEFAWDHSAVGRNVSAPLAAGMSLELPLTAGRRPLSTLDWLSRQHPDHVAAALASVLNGR